jgi:hypothetical protein
MLSSFFLIAGAAHFVKNSNRTYQLVFDIFGCCEARQLAATFARGACSAVLSGQQGPIQGGSKLQRRKRGPQSLFNLQSCRAPISKTMKPLKTGRSKPLVSTADRKSNFRLENDCSDPPVEWEVMAE